MAVVLCPECGRFIDPNKESVVKHAYAHWGVLPNRIHEIRNPEARRRYEVLMKDNQEVE